MEALFSYYQIMVILLALVWLLIFITKPDVRNEMLVLGVLALVLMPITLVISRAGLAEVQTAIENLQLADLIFPFVLAGIASSVFHALFGKHYHKLPKVTKSNKTGHVAQMWLMKLFVLFLVMTWLIISLVFLFSLSIAGSAVIAAIILAVYIVSHRHDLLADAIWSALLTAFTVFVASSIASGLAGIDFTISPLTTEYVYGNVPLDLLLWSLAFGAALGPLYEYSRRLDLLS